MKIVPVEKFPGYFVSDGGDVFTSKTNSKWTVGCERLHKLRPGLRGHGKNKYFHVILSKGTKASRVGVSVHRLVAQHFIPNLDNKPQLNHIDGDKRNNRADNLEWVTCKENQKHAHNTGLNTSPSGFGARRARLTKETITEIRVLLHRGVKQCDIAATVGVSQSVVSQVKRKTRSWYDPDNW